MEEYEKIIKRINSNFALKNGIDTVFEESDCEYLNLTHLKWDEHLKNDAVYQRHINRNVLFNTPKEYEYVKTQYVTNDQDSIKVIVVAQCNYLRSQSKFDEKTGTVYDSKAFISAKCCPPLDEICKAYNSGIVTDLELSTNSKFFLQSCCGPTVCTDCYSYVSRNNFNKNVDPWLCISTTKIFNGHDVLNVLGDVVLEIFKRGPFWAVLKVNVNCRQFYGEGHRTMKLSGIIQEMIIFKENALLATKPKKMKFMEQLPGIVNSLPSTSYQVVKSASNTDASSENKPRYSYKHLPSGITQDSKSDDELAELQNKTVCLPSNALNSYLQQEELKRNEGEYDLAHYETKKF